MTTDDISQLRETLAKLQQVIQNRTDELDLLRDISSPEEIAQSEADLTNLRGKEAAIIAKLEGSGAVAQSGGQAVAATGEGSTAIGTAGRDVITGDNNQLIGTIINLYNQDQPQETNETTLRRQIADYLRGVYNRYSRLELRGIKQEGQQVIRLDLEQVYVPLAAKTYRHGQTAAIELDQVLQQGQRVIIIGGPGSGKTTVLLHLASTLALALGSDTPTLAEEKLGFKPQPLASRDDTEEPLQIPLPIYIPLSSYARYRRNLSKNAPAERDTLAAFISHYLIRRGQGSFDLPADFFQQLLRTGRQVMVLLDGLDEVPGENERVEVRQAIEGLLDGRPGLQIVTTCRTAAYQGRAVIGRDFREVVVLPLEADHIAQLVQQAYNLPSLFGSEPGLAEQKSRDLLAAIDRLETQRRQLYGEETEPLITSPLLVRMLIIVHVSDRRLPDQRAELYKKATDNLLLPDFHPDQEVANELGGLVGGDPNIHLELAQHLAFTLHQRGDQQGRELDEFELEAILFQHSIYHDLAQDFIRLARSRSTLLEERDGQYRFIHLAFQEFLVARYLADVQIGEDGYNGIAAFLEQGPLLDSWWREPILLISGYFSIDRPTSAQKFLQRLAGLDEYAMAQRATLPPDIPLAAAELAGAAALEWPTLPTGLKDALADRLADFFRHPDWLADTSPILRARAGDTLAQLGDPRPEVMTIDEMQFCAIPVGPFIMGSNDDDELAYDNEKPRHQVDIEYNYWLARYPVTVAQWCEFVETSGHQPTDQDSLQYPSNRPVHSVTWPEAVKFCEWLTDRWQKAGLLPTGWQIKLPSEAEWEKAARGGLKLPSQPIIGPLAEIELGGFENMPVLKANDQPPRRYPWGVEVDPNRCNYSETGINAPNTVGCFPGGTSHYGVEEMSGNVWEWCVTVWQANYQDYQNDDDPTKIDVPRVLRGGAFRSDGRFVRCAIRYWYYPDSWIYYLGFRVSVSPLL